MASVLKTTTGGPIRSEVSGYAGLVGFNLQDLMESSRKQIEATQKEAERLLAQAQNDAVALRKQAQEEGRRQGLADGQKEFQQQLTKAAKEHAAADLATLRQSVEQLWQQEHLWLQQWREMLVEMVMKISERMVGRRFEQDEEIVTRWAQEALELARGGRAITLAVHPETLVRVGERLEELLRISGAPEDARLEPDESVAKAGVIVRQEGGQVDLQLKSQIARLVEALD